MARTRNRRIFDVLCERIPNDASVMDVSVGIFWTYVRTQYGSALSATAHRWCVDPPGAIIPPAGTLCGMRVSDLCHLYDSESLTARSLANAAVAASFRVSDMTGEAYPGKAQDLIEVLCQGEKKHIALVGHFHFADDLRQIANRLDIYELEGRCQEGDIPSERIPEHIPEADIVVMTSSTILTHATERILTACRPGSFKMIVGPTVPVHPVLWEYGLDAVCGTVIHDDVQVCAAARQGGNHKQMTGSEKINFVRPGFRLPIGV